MGVKALFAQNSSDGQRVVAGDRGYLQKLLATLGYERIGPGGSCFGAFAGSGGLLLSTRAEDVIRFAPVVRCRFSCYT